MINYSFTCKSMHWPRRLKKIKILVKNILKFKKDLNFDQSVDYNCNLILVNDKFIKKMNLQFRNKNKITDVLTFVSDVRIKQNKSYKICDIFISAEVIKKDSIKNKVNFYDHIAHLIIHSFLHINGYVHEKIKDFNKMQKIEILILKKIGISNPYL